MFDAYRDVTMAEVDGSPLLTPSEAGSIRATASFASTACDGAVLPEWRRRGIGSALLAENQRRQRELAATHQTERPRVLGSWASDRQKANYGLLRNIRLRAGALVLRDDSLAGGSDPGRCHCPTVSTFVR